ncbi:MAG: hypothetical protein KGJ60_12365 [Verrucomicrobiota bacterium]|nr:hypothetical protein [Verrucomicrobiota bacterium]
MKTNTHRPQKTQRGGAMLIAVLIFSLTLGAALGSYLVLVYDQNQLANRSETWNGALAAAEAGVEDALAQLNSGINLIPIKTNFSDNGWGSLSLNDYGPLTRSLAGGSYTVSISTAMVSNLQEATITSQGSMTVPVTGGQISRSVQVMARYFPLFNVALGAVSNINGGGTFPVSDSWNSHDTNNIEDNNGLYNGYSGTNGSIASEQGFVSIGNETVKGNLYLGPNATYNGSGDIYGTVYYDYNVDFPNATLPTPPLGWVPAPSTQDVHDFTVSGYYIVNDSEPIVIEPGVIATLDIKTTSFSPTSITINGGMTNAGTIIMYQESGSATIGGNSTSGGTVNYRPENFYYYGLPGVNSVTLSGTSVYVGALYAPQAVLTLNGGGNANNLEGSAIVNSVKMNAHYDFHYDESLAWLGPMKGYVPVSWQELAGSASP